MWLPTILTWDNIIHTDEGTSYTITPEDVLQFFVYNHIPWEVHNNIQFSKNSFHPLITDTYAKIVIRWDNKFLIKKHS